MNPEWTRETDESCLYKVMRAYWRIFYSTNYYKYELLSFMKKFIKKRLPKRILSSKVWFFGVEKKKIRFNPRGYDESEKSFEQLLISKN